MSFKIWSHGYPYRTVRWHHHPEYEIQLITSTTGSYFVGDYIGNFEPGNLVMTGINLPHNWVSNVRQDDRIDERCIVLQFTADFADRAIGVFPEFRKVQLLLKASNRGLLFPAKTGTAAEPIMREMLSAQGLRRVALFFSLLDLLEQNAEPVKLASANYRVKTEQYQDSRIPYLLSHIKNNLSRELRETDLAEMAGQSASAFSRYFRRHVGVTFVQYVNQLRINLACQLLITEELSITDICYRVGFNNLSNFHRQFFVQKFMPPSRWRAQQKLSTASTSNSDDSEHYRLAITKQPKH
ncbi:AraC family transcriptional regulator [Rhodanobacter sp. BL-MT-08]